MSNAITDSTDDVPGPISMAKARRPNAYALFVKDEIKKPEIQALPPKERFRAIAARWRAQKADEPGLDNYTTFLQQTIQRPEIQALSPQERFKAVAAEWRLRKTMS